LKRGGRDVRQAIVEKPEMADVSGARSDPKEQLWDELDNLHAGLLGIDGSGLHMQPMAFFPDQEGRRIWFLTKLDTALYKALSARSMAQFAVISNDQTFHACLRGELSDHYDRERLDAIWSPVVGAWFDGKDDPDLKMLALDLTDGAIWASAGALAFAWETVKANVTDSRPDMGVHREFVFG
jgi:general stress protein 26